MSSSIKISKAEAAKRQLRVAIQLFFNDDDPVSIHTLAAAAHQVLMDLAKDKGVESFIRGEQALQYIRKEKQKWFLQFLAEPENFFKHADRDPEDTLDFYPAATDYLLWDACRMYLALTKEIDHILIVFQIWFSDRNKEIFLSEEFRRVVKEVAKTISVTGEKKAYADALEYYQQTAEKK